jgi:hypothetical protein
MTALSERTFGAVVRTTPWGAHCARPPFSWRGRRVRQPRSAHGIGFAPASPRENRRGISNGAPIGRARFACARGLPLLNLSSALCC